ncbi:MAG: hypothetical protein R6W06_06220 [Prochlorococcaceae cyanobacterium]
MSSSLASSLLRRLPAWLPALVFTALFLALAAPRWFDPASVLDDTRQFGPPLLWPPGAPPTNVPQLAYFAAGTPPLYRGLALALIGALGWPPAAALKLLAVLLVLPTALGLWLLADGLVGDGPLAGGRGDASPEKAVLALFLVGNVLVSTQVLSGTPRDLGSLLLVLALVALLHRRWLLLLPLLGLLAGVYPTYGLLLLATLLIALLLEGAAASGAGCRRLLPLLIAAPLVALLGVHWGGPAVQGQNWGPTLRLFVGTAPQAQPPWAAVLAEAARSGGTGPATLLAVPPLELLATDRFRPLPGAKHLLPWIGSLALLALAALMAALMAALPAALPLAWRQRPFPQGLPPWRRRVLLAVLLAGALLYSLAFALAFALHNPARYADLPARLLLSLAELAILQPLLAWPAFRPWSLLAALGLGLALAMAVRPSGPVTLPLAALQPLQDRLAAPLAAGGRARVLVLNPGGDSRLEALNDALALVSGATSFYAQELDRGFHLGAIAQNLALRRDRDWLARQRLDAAAGLPHPWLEARGISHLLLVSPRAQAAGWTPACRTAGPWRRRGREQLLLVDLACERRHTSEVTR